MASISTESDPYTIRWTEPANKDLSSKVLRSYKDRVLTEIDRLRFNPRLGHRLQGSLKGVRSLEFALPGGAYRATYVMSVRERACLVFMVGPHEGFYPIAERRYESLHKQGRA